MNYHISAALNGALAESAIKILAILQKHTAGVGNRILNPDIDLAVGTIVDDIVATAGGDAVALFAVTESLSKVVPFGARRLRTMRSAYVFDKTLDDTALAIKEMLAGDEHAGSVAAGHRINATITLLVGVAGEALILDGLATRLELSPDRLRLFRDVFLISNLCGENLSKRLAGGCTLVVLRHLSRFLRVDAMPWRQRDMALKAAEEIHHQKLSGNEIAKLVSRMLAEPHSESECLPIAPSWHIPVTRPKKNAIETAGTESAAWTGPHYS